jgi:hypothetical protein
MKTLRLLTIGNSFADNALTYLEAMAASTKRVRFRVGRTNLGGCSLEKHWNLAAYTRSHPEYKPYNLGPSRSGASRPVTLQEALVAENWDFVTLQQVSAQSWRRESFEPYLGKLHALVRERAPRAKILLHQTWAYRADSPFLPENSMTQELMFERIRETYRHFAARYKCGLLPSGEAVQRARRAPGHAFCWPEPGFDYQHARAPALPRQEHSLAVGWHWAISWTADGIPAMRLDANHLNAEGCYLAGAVWFEALTGLDVREVSFRPAGIPAKTRAFLRDTAHEAVRQV